MPILASLGTANDRAFGFGDGSFASGYALPETITNNAEIIYDASNPLSNALGRSSFIISALYPSYNSNDRRYGDYWYIPVESGTQVFPGDTLKNYPELEHTATVIDVERNVEMYNTYGGVTVTGDRVVINSYMVYSPSMVYPSSTDYWYDISGNNRHATLTGFPNIEGAGGNQYFAFSGTGSDYASLANFRNTSTENWTIHLIMSFSGGTAKEIIDGTKWGLEARNGGQLRAYPTVDFWVTGSSGGTNSYAGTKVLVSLTLTRSSNISQFETALNGSTTTVFNNQVSFADYVSTLAADFGKNGGNIYLYAGYKTSQAPTASQAYNALKGRFGL